MCQSGLKVIRRPGMDLKIGQNLRGEKRNPLFSLKRLMITHIAERLRVKTVLTFNPPYRCFIRPEPNFRKRGGWKPVCSGKGCLVQFEIVSHDHESFQVQNVPDIVSDQGLECFFVSVSFEIIPKQDSEKAVYPVEFSSVNSETPFTFFQSSLIAETFQNMSQVNMSLIHFNVKVILDERDVKAFAVVRDDEIIVPDVLSEIIQIPTVDVVKDVFPVIERNGRDKASPFQTVCLDVQISRGMPEFRKKTPVMHWGQQLAEISEIISPETLNGLADATGQKIFLCSRKTYGKRIEFRVNIPGFDTGDPEAMFCLKPDARDMTKSIFQHFLLTSGLDNSSSSFPTIIEPTFIRRASLRADTNDLNTLVVLFLP